MIADSVVEIEALRWLVLNGGGRRVALVFREVDQLHPMLVNEPWIFGDEWSLALSETRLPRMVRTLITQHGNVEFAANPVLLPSGKAREVLGRPCVVHSHSNVAGDDAPGASNVLLGW